MHKEKGHAGEDGLAHKKDAIKTLARTNVSFYPPDERLSVTASSEVLVAT